MVNFRETESRMVGGQGLGEKGKWGAGVQWGQFQSGTVNKFWRWVVVTGGSDLKAADLHTSGGKFCVTCILPVPTDQP